MKNMTTKFNISNTQETAYGWWDEAGRNWFWQLPQVSFINSNEGLDNQQSIQNRSFVQAENEQPNQLSMRLIELLIGLLTYEGKLNRHGQGACSTIELSDRVTVVVEGDTESFQSTFSECVLSDARFSTYSSVRPIETYPD